VAWEDAMAVRICRAPGAPVGSGAIVCAAAPQPPAGRGIGEGLGFVSRDFADLFRELQGELANKDPIELKPPYRVLRAPPEAVRGGFNPYGVLCIKARMPGEKFPLEAIVKGEWMKWAIVESLGETLTRLCKTRVGPKSILFCADEVEVLEVQMPFVGEHLWQFCEFRFDFRVAMKSAADAEKVVHYAFSRMTEVEAEFCKNLEYKFRNIYHITILSLQNKRFLLMDGQRHSDELALFEAAQANDVAAIEALVGRGVDADASHKAAGFPDKLLDEDQRFLYLQMGRTALLAAAEEGYMQAMKLLLDAQADVNFQDTSGFHALYLAAGAPDSSEELVKFLLDQDADLHLANNAGYTPLHNACGSGEVGALKALLDAGADWNAKSRSGAAPVHVAVINDQPCILDALLARRANLDMPAFGGNTPVHEGVMQNNPSIIQKLFDLRADINIESGPDSGFATPLKMAIDRKKKKAAKILRELGALERIEHDYADSSEGELAALGDGELVPRVLGREKY